MPDFNWISTDITPAPGDYLTRRDLINIRGKHGLRSIRAVILPAHWNGERWNLPEQPHYYRPLPTR